MATDVTDTEDDQYDIRLFESGDRRGYLALYETVFETASDEWFTWKYEDNPYTDHVPIVVAETDGRIVGAKSALAMPVRIGSSTRLALQPCDTMVHPDHRRRGVYSRMTEQMKDVYADRAVDLFFNFPNEKTLSGSLKHGWRVVGEVPAYYRVQNPVEYAGAGGGPVSSVVESISTRLLRQYYSLRERSIEPPSTVTVDRRTDIPASELGALYERTVPDRIHTVRDERFYDWRFQNPKWEYTAYTTHRGGEVVAAAVVGTRPDQSDSSVLLTDVLPLRGKAWLTGVFEALLQRLVEEYRDAEILALAGESVPETVRHQFGFRPDTTTPMKHATKTDTLVAYPLSDDTDETDLFERSNWLLTFADMDTR